MESLSKAALGCSVKRSKGLGGLLWSTPFNGGERSEPKGVQGVAEAAHEVTGIARG